MLFSGSLHSLALGRDDIAALGMTIGRLGMTWDYGVSISVAGTFGVLRGMDGAGASITFIDFHFPWRNLFSRMVHITIANVVVNIHST